MKRLLAALLAGIIAVSMLGCSQDSSKASSDNKNKQSATQSSSNAAVNRNGQVRSYLTGQWVDKSVNSMRPLAVMMSNQPEAPSQSGLSDAKIIYEAPAEGNYSTRLMGLFEDWEKVKKIGSIRSCRNCYVYFMKEFDAIYVHAGQSMPALELVTSDYIDNISTMDKDFNKVFYQDLELSMPHNTFTTGEGAMAGAKSRGYNLTHASDYKGKFLFNEDDDKKIELTDGDTANYVYVGYGINKPWFAFNKDDGKYYRFQHKKGVAEKQSDADDGKQAAVDNIILQYCYFDHYLWEEEETLYWDITLTGSGKGKFITNGKSIDITWKKDSEFGITKYYDSKGKEITLNQGKTWVCIINNATTKDIEISAVENIKKQTPVLPVVVTPEPSTEAENEGESENEPQAEAGINEDY